MVDLKWHPFKQVLAFAHTDDAVFIYDLGTRCNFVDIAYFPITGLSNPKQTRITCMGWHPSGNAQLAVGSSQGVCLWKFYFDQADQVGTMASMVHSDAAVHPQPWMQLLQVPYFSNVSCLNWSPDGRLLAVGYEHTPALVIWDTVTLEHVVLKRTFGKGTTSLLFNQNGDFLIQTLSGSGLLVWETIGWSSTPFATRAPCHVLKLILERVLDTRDQIDLVCFARSFASLSDSNGKGCTSY